MQSLFSTTNTNSNSNNNNNNNNSSTNNASFDREQALAIIRHLIVEADDFFVQQQSMLQTSYAELNGRLEQLRYKAQCNQATMANGSSLSSQQGGLAGASMGGGLHNLAPLSCNPSHFSLSPGGVSLPGNGGNGSAAATTVAAAAAAAAAVNSTPMRTSNYPVGPGKSNFFGAFGSSTIMPNGTATPPNKHLALESSSVTADQSPSATQPDDWTNLSATHHNHESIMASPQATGKLSLDDLLSRFTNHETSPALNFDALYDQLTGGRESETPRRGSMMPERSNSNGGPIGTPNDSRAALQVLHTQQQQHSNGNAHDSTASRSEIVASITGNDRDVIPIDTLRSLHDQHLTTSVRATYEKGRPCVTAIVGGEPDTQIESLGISPTSSCQVLVEFKRKRVLQYDSTVYVAPGSYVVVGGDRGEDIGLVIYTWCEVASSPSSGSATAGTPHSDQQQQSGRPSVVGIGLTGTSLTRSIGVGSGTVLRLASEADVNQLHATQAELERRAIDVCAQRVLEHALPMVIVDAEYQFDKKKLTFFYEAQQRMDFRELVRDLYKTFRARIWMEAVDV